MGHRVFEIAFLLIALMTWTPAGAPATTHEFFKNKTVRIAVGASTGGAFDT